MNDNGPSPPSPEARERAHDEAAQYMARKLAEMRERMKVTPLVRMPEDHWDRRRALKEKRTDIE